MENFFELPQVLCLERLVGISRKSCECLVEVLPSKIDLVRNSQTGLFIDEHDGAVGCLFLEKSKCGEGDIWDKLIMARKEAVLQMMIDSSVGLESRFTKMAKYSHHVGELGYGSLLNLTTGKQAIKFKTRNLYGGKIEFSGIGMLAKILTGNVFETVRVTFKNLTKDRVLKVVDFDVKMQTGYFSGPDATIYDMPIFLLDCDGSEYEISYEYDSSKMLIYDNDLTCNCGGVRTTLGKYYERLPDGKARGLMFNVSYVCDESYLLCALANSGTTLTFLVAEGIRCLTMYKFLNNAKAKGSFGATIENVLNISGIDNLVDSFSMKYNATLEDIRIKTLTMSNFECFTCNTYDHAKKGFIEVSDTYVDGNKNLNEIYQYVNRNGNARIYGNPFLI